MGVVVAPATAAAVVASAAVAVEASAAASSAAAARPVLVAALLRAAVSVAGVVVVAALDLSRDVVLELLRPLAVLRGAENGLLRDEWPAIRSRIWGPRQQSLYQPLEGAPGVVLV